MSTPIVKAVKPTRCVWCREPFNAWTRRSSWPEWCRECKAEREAEPDQSNDSHL